MKTIKSVKGFNKTVEHSSNILVYFGAEWCGHCKNVRSNVAKFAGINRTKVTVLHVEVDELPELVKEYGVKNIPMFIPINNQERGEGKFGMLTVEELKDLTGIKD